MFTYGFQKVAAIDALKKIVKPVAGEVAAASEKFKNSMYGAKGTLRAGPRPYRPSLIGKSGNKLTPEYMERTYGVKGWKEPE